MRKSSGSVVSHLQFFSRAVNQTPISQELLPVPAGNQGSMHVQIVLKG
jgi:hypothetical protein